MPVIIQSPEAWFRTHQRDLYVINYQEENDFVDDDQSVPLLKQEQDMLISWFETHLPNTTLGIIGPSEYSGWIEGGPTYLTADFDAAGLSIFEEYWHENSSWFVEVWPIARWKQRIDSARLLITPLTALENLRWWDTFQGILLVSSYTSDPGYCEDGLPSLEDGWWKLQQAYPEFSKLPANTFPCGTFWPLRYAGASPFFFVEFVWDQAWDSRGYIANTDNGRRLKKTLGIPEGLNVQIEIQDF